MPLSKTITSTPSSGMFNTQNETFNEVRTDASADFKLVTTEVLRLPSLAQQSLVAEYVNLSELSAVAGTEDFTEGAGDDVQSFRRIVTVEDLAAETIFKVQSQRLEDGVVVSETIKFSN